MKLPVACLQNKDLKLLIVAIGLELFQRIWNKVGQIINKSNIYAFKFSHCNKTETIRIWASVGCCNTPEVLGVKNIMPALKDNINNNLKYIYLLQLLCDYIYIYYNESVQIYKLLYHYNRARRLSMELNILKYKIYNLLNFSGFCYNNSNKYLTGFSIFLITV